MNSPAVTVLLCVHNGAETLGAALDSVWRQTFRDFELVVVDDASTDSTPALLDACDDPRLVRLRNPENLGLTRSLNVGLRAARGPLIARLDADDTCHPERLARQVAYLEAHPDVGLLGTAALPVDPALPRPASETELRWWLLFDNMFVHSSVMFRAELARPAGYNESFRCAQDYALWSAWAARTRLALLPDPLVTVSDRPDRISRTRAGEQQHAARAVSLANLGRVLGQPVDAEQREALLRVFPRPPDQPGPADVQACRLCLRLFTAFSTSFGVVRSEALALRRAWILRVLNSFAWHQRAEVRRSGWLADCLRAAPLTTLWYLWMRVRCKVLGAPVKERPA